VIVHLLRHAKTEMLSSTGRDFDRKLAIKGHKQSAQLKEIIEGKHLDISHLYCSSAQRTRETANLIFGENKSMTFHDDLYLCEQSELVQFIWNLDTSTDIMLIGHNFGLSNLASYFLDEDIYLKTGSMISIDFPFSKSSDLSKATGSQIFAHRLS